MVNIYNTIYQFNHILSAQPLGIKHVHTVVKLSPTSISRTFSTSQTETLSPWNTHSSPLSQSLVPPSTSCLCGSDSSRDLLWMESDSVCPSVTGFSPWASCPQGSFTLKQVSEPPSVLGLKNSPLYRWTIFCLSILLSLASWVTSIFGLLWLVLLWTQVYKYLSKSLGIYPKEELQDQQGNFQV